ncbi:MAG: hypothetical protein ACLQG3_00185 [Terracidiphilus sp.]
MKNIILAVLAAAFPIAVLAQPKPCSTEKVNGDCTFIVDRVNPLQPPTLQMYPGATVTVKIAHALPFEQVSFDWQSSTGTLTPDQSSAILNALSASLQKFVAAAASPAQAPLPGARLPQGAAVDLCASVTLATAVACTGQMIADARLAVGDIGSLVNDDTLVYNSVTQLPVARSLADYDNARTRILCRTLGSDLPQTVKLDGFTPIHCGAADHDLVAEQQALTLLVGSSTQGVIPALVTYTNTLVAPLEAIAQDLLQLNSAQGSDGVLGAIVDPARSKNPGVPSCNSSLSNAPDSSVYTRLLQRQVTCAVNVFNLVANSIASVPATPQKRTILTISANYADSRIETSAGVMVSALPSRSFAAISTYTGTPPTVSGITVQETDTRPLIVPYAAVHVRLGSDWLWKFDQRRGAIYATGLVGVNPNTTTADFGAGISVAWRSLVLSPVAHFAHDVRLTGGFTDNEQLGTTFTGTLPTQQFWTTSFGIGIGIRVPLISGR